MCVEGGDSGERQTPISIFWAGVALSPLIVWIWCQCTNQAPWKSLPVLSAKIVLKRKQAGLSKLVFSSCITWLSQLIVMTDFKQRPDSIWQPGDSSFLLLGRLQAITVVSHAEPTICQPCFCLHHHLTEHQKAIRGRQGWQFAYFFRHLFGATLKVNLSSCTLGSLFTGETTKVWLHLVLSYDSCSLRVP